MPMIVHPGSSTPVWVDDAVHPTGNAPTEPKAESPVLADLQEKQAELQAELTQVDEEIADASPASGPSVSS